MTAHGEPGKSWKSKAAVIGSAVLFAAVLGPFLPGALLILGFFSILFLLGAALSAESRTSMRVSLALLVGMFCLIAIAAILDITVNDFLPALATLAAASLAAFASERLLALVSRFRDPPPADTGS